MEREKFENRVWLSSPTMHGDEFKYMKEAYESNWMSTVGENIDEIERMVAEEVGCDHAVALSSGTAALHMAIRLMNLKPNEKVFCSDLTFAATVNPIIYEGGTPVFIDSEYTTWNMDPEVLDKAFKMYPEVRLVVMAHLYGTPGRMDEIRKICQANNAILIEDAAESLGATYKGKQTGSLGDYNAISFNGNKIITGSSGGMFLTNNEEDAEIVRKWSTQSRERAAWYEHREIGFNYRMSNVVAGVVRGQLPYLQEHVAKKTAIYKRYRDGFEDLPLTMNPYKAIMSVPNFWLSCILLDKEVVCSQSRSTSNSFYIKTYGKTCPAEILSAISSLNAEGRPIWKPMHLQPVFQYCTFVKRSMQQKSVSKDLFDRGLCLPSDIKMTPEQQDRIIEAVKSCFD